MDQNFFKDKLSNFTIVYIEDDDEIRSYLEEFFKRYNTNIYSADSAEKGLELYKQHQPDLIIADINLPNMNGIEFIKKIRKDDTTTRIVISSAYTNKEFTLEAVELQISRYLVKPITMSELLAMLKKVFAELETLKSSEEKINLGENFYFNTKTDRLTIDDKEIELRKKELELLKFFISKKDSVISYEMLENGIWYDTVMTQDAIRSQIRNIRKKTYPKIFQNISGVGYKLGNN